jgi:TonB family protein
MSSFWRLLFLLAGGCAAGAAVARAEPVAAAQPTEPDRVLLFQHLEAGDFGAARPIVEAAAARGEAQGQLLLGLMAATGAGMPLDNEQAVAAWQRAAEHGSRAAARLLLVRQPAASQAQREQWVRVAGNLTPSSEWLPSTLALDDGGHVQLVYQPAWHWNQARTDDPDAAYSLAQHELHDPDRFRGEFTAYLERLEAAAQAGSARAFADLAAYAAVGFGRPADPAQARSYLQQAAERGHAPSQFHFGRELLDAEPAQQAEARPWLEKAAAQDHPDALNLLGDLWRDGQLGRPDDRRAVQLYQRAVELGHSESQADLGWMYEQGRGVPRDPSRAAALYTAAAAAGQTWARVALASLYLRGDGVPQDIPHALAELETTARAGNAAAMFQLAHLYQTGEHVDPDAQRAFEWFEEAARAGHAQAQNMVGWLLLHGTGIEPDPEEARTWFVLAAAKGDETAMENLANVHASDGPLPDPVEHRRWIDRLSESTRPEIRARALARRLAAAPDLSAAEPLLAEMRLLTNHSDLALAEIATVATTAALHRFYRGQLAAEETALQILDNLYQRGSRQAAKAMYLFLATAEHESVRDPLRALQGLLPLAEEGDLQARALVVHLLAAGPPAVRDLARGRELYNRYREDNPQLDQILTQDRVQEAPPPPPEAELARRIQALGPRPEDAMPVPVHQVPPPYPIYLRQAAIEGEALISFVVNPDGRVEAGEIVRASEAEFGPAALEAVRQWRFAPAIKDGQPVPLRMQVPIIFSLQK